MQSPATFPSPPTPPARPVQSVSGVVTPGPRVPSPSPAPAGDRTAADLRTRLQAARWMEDVVLCADLVRWQRERKLDAVAAAKELGLPHVTSDVVRRLSAGLRPYTPAEPWAELRVAVADGATAPSGDDLRSLAAVLRERISRGLQTDSLRDVVSRLVSDCGSMRRAAMKLAHASSEPDGVNWWEQTVRTAVAVPKPPPAPSDDLDVLAKRVAAEVGKPGKRKSTRTIEVARAVADAMRELGVSYVQLGKKLAGREGCKENAWQMRLLAYAREYPDVFAGLPEGTATPRLKAVASAGSAKPTAPALGNPVADLAAAIDAEVASGETRSASVARRVAEVRRSAGAGVNGTPATWYGLARELAATPGNRLGYKGWQKRLAAYAGDFPDVFADISTTPRATAKPPATASTPGSAVLVGRPVMLVSGRLRVVVSATMEIGPESPLWADAVAAMNADAAT